MIDLLLSVMAAVLGVASWVGVYKAVELDDAASVLRYLLVMLMLGTVAFANTWGRF